MESIKKFLEEYEQELDSDLIKSLISACEKVFGQHETFKKFTGKQRKTRKGISQSFIHENSSDPNEES